MILVNVSHGLESNLECFHTIRDINLHHCNDAIILDKVNIFDPMSRAIIDTWKYKSTKDINIFDKKDSKIFHFVVRMAKFYSNFGSFENFNRQTGNQFRIYFILERVQ